MLATAPGEVGLAIESLSPGAAVGWEELPPSLSLICLATVEASESTLGTPVGRGGAERFVATAPGDVGLAAKESSGGDAVDSD